MDYLWLQIVTSPWLYVGLLAGLGWIAIHRRDIVIGDLRSRLRQAEISAELAKQVDRASNMKFPFMVEIVFHDGVWVKQNSILHVHVRYDPERGIPVTEVELKQPTVQVPAPVSGKRKIRLSS
jgi:hypothetical protein